MARLLKALNFLLYKAVLPYEAEISPDIELCHYGIGVVIHPNVKIGRRVKIFHEVTLATSTWIGSPYYIEIGDDVMIGAGAKIIAKPGSRSAHRQRRPDWSQRRGDARCGGWRDGGGRSGPTP